MARPKTWRDLPGPYLAALDGMRCLHGCPRGARWCPLCRANLAADRAGRPRPFGREAEAHPPVPSEVGGYAEWQAARRAAGLGGGNDGA